YRVDAPVTRADEVPLLLLVEIMREQVLLATVHQPFIFLDRLDLRVEVVGQVLHGVELTQDDRQGVAVEHVDWIVRVQFDDERQRHRDFRGAIADGETAGYVLRRCGLARLLRAVSHDDLVDAKPERGVSMFISPTGTGTRWPG